ncbi:MAG: PVC-type heme-binding CxxCH protein, partial [Planctomycetota bacterium]
TDRDGTADTRKVFAEGIPFPAAIATGMGGLWLGAPPNLLFIPDADGDDRGDMDDIEVRLTGWGIRDRHETLNSLLWGPDGWLYGCQGYATPSRVGKPAGKGKIYQHNDPFPNSFDYADEPVDINGGVWRYHPIKERFEVVAHGFSNPWGIDYDAKGQLFITACVIPHLWHVIPGGIYHRQGGRHFNPNVYSDIKTIANHRHRSAHGGARVYLSDAFPKRYQGQIFMANIHEHAVLTDILEPAGSGYSGQHGEDFALANNAQWVGFGIEIGPDGMVYALDWHDADICGKEVLNKETGRVFRFAPKESSAKSFPHRYEDLDQLTDLQLTEMQTVESAWHARRARVVLQHRANLGKIASEAISQLKTQFSEAATTDLRLRGMWALHLVNELTPDMLQNSLVDDDAHIRAWSVQLLCEDLVPPKPAVQEMISMAINDPSPVVRLFLASAMQRMEKTNAWQIAEALCQHEEDIDDHNLPKMIWYGLEPLVMTDLDRSIQLAKSSRIPMLSRFIARRVATGNKIQELVAGMEGSAKDRELLLGLRDALEGQFDIQSPAGWSTLYAKLQATGGDTARIALQLSQQFGDSVAAETMLATLKDKTANLRDRQQALQGLAGRKRPELERELTSLIDDADLRREAIRAIGSFDNRQLADAILKRYDQFSEEEKLDVVHTLASRGGYGRALTDAIERGDVPKRDVPAYVARLMRRVVGNRFVDVWGQIEELDASKDAQFAKYRELLTSKTIGDADASAGRLIFNRTCAACHKLYGHGGVVGPDITGANRTNMEYLLGNILTPSAIIQDDYKMHIVLTDDGRIFSGIPTEENERRLKLRVADRPEPITIAKSQIESREVASISMMPEGTLDNLKDEEVAQLFAYLQRLKQVPLPEQDATE